MLFSSGGYVTFSLKYFIKIYKLRKQTINEMYTKVNYSTSRKHLSCLKIVDVVGLCSGYQWLEDSPTDSTYIYKITSYALNIFKCIRKYHNM